MDHKKVHLVLNYAQKMIADPAAWIKHKSCADKDGARTEITKAVKFCAFGALERSIVDLSLDDPITVRNLVERHLVSASGMAGETLCLTKINDLDETTHDDIMNMFKKAILYLETRPTG